MAESFRSNDQYYSCSDSSASGSPDAPVEADVEITADGGNVDLEYVGNDVIGDGSSEIEADTGSHSISTSSSNFSGASLRI